MAFGGVRIGIVQLLEFGHQIIHRKGADSGITPNLHFPLDKFLIDQPLPHLAPRGQTEIRSLVVLKGGKQDSQLDVAPGDDLVADSDLDTIHDRSKGGRRGYGQNETHDQERMLHQKACPIEKKN